MPRDYRLADANLLALGLAVKKDGIAADAAISFIVGNPRTSEDVDDHRHRSGRWPPRSPSQNPECISALFPTRSRTSSPALGISSTPSSAATASARPCTRTRTCRTPAAPHSDTCAAHRPAARARTVGDDRHRPSDHRPRRRVDAAQRNQGSYSTQRAHHRDHRQRSRDPHPPDQDRADS